MALQRKYSVLLEDRLNQLDYLGFCTIKKGEMYYWFGKDKITNVVWREITKIWNEDYYGSEKPIKVKIGGDSRQTYMLYINKGTKSIGELSD